MKKRALLGALIVTIAACTAGPASGPSTESDGPAMIAPLALEPPPVYGIIGYRDRLELSSQQVTTLDSIATSARTANSLLIDSLEEKAVTRNNSTMIQVNTPERPILERIRQNNQAVLTQVAEILTAEQETEVCALYEDDRDSDAQPPRRAGVTQSNDAFRRGAERTDTAIVIRPFTMWPWCAAGRAARDSTAARR